MTMMEKNDENEDDAADEDLLCIPPAPAETGVVARAADASNIIEDSCQIRASVSVVTTELDEVPHPL